MKLGKRVVLVKQEAGILFVGDLVKYVANLGSHLTRDFLLEVVAPHIAAYFPEEHKKIAEVLDRPLLCAYFEPPLAFDGSSSPIKSP
jgi:hypothetical protein